jgi:hypothetical protein
MVDSIKSYSCFVYPPDEGVVVDAAAAAAAEITATS